MDSVKELWLPVMPPPPPPPPPPPMPVFNGNSTEVGRSQLLSDIRKGATLKKTPVSMDSNSNELSPSDKLKKQTQDLLQAELTSTLKRRKPVVINEPPKYDYPTYDTDINKNNESPSIHSVNTTTTTTTITANVKPLNVNAILSVVTGIKLPDIPIQYDANSTTSATTTTASTKPSSINDKPKITHGKPNFIINNTKENKPSEPMNSNGQSNGQKVVVSGPIVQIKSYESVDSKFHRPSYFTSHLATVDKSNGSKCSDAESQVEKCKSIFLIKSQQSVENDIKPQKSPQKPTEFQSKFEKHIEQPPKQVVGSMKKNSVDETTKSLISVANKKALFEQPKGTVLKTALTLKPDRNFTNKPSSMQTTNGKFNTLNSPRILSQMNDQQKPGVTTVTLNKNVSYGSMGRPQAKDRVDHFERTVHTETSSSSSNNNGKFETKQFEQKTFVSFSKDLHNAPNNYPEQIRVKKTVITERSLASPDNPFQNIRFSIQTNGQVIPKPKNLLK